MDNVNCRNCGKSISRLARTCPECGHPQGLLARSSGISPRTAFRYLLVYPFNAVLLFGFIGFLAGQPHQSIIEVALGVGIIVHVLGWVALFVKPFVKPDKSE